MLNSPSNPTGSMYTKEELVAIGDVLKSYENIDFFDYKTEKIELSFKFFKSDSPIRKF